jgi:hypothetical protein
VILNRSFAFAWPPGTRVVYLTSGSTWIVPDDWNPLNNTIEAIGAGGGGGGGTLGGGGGGGNYSRTDNYAGWLPGQTIGLVVGAGGSGGSPGNGGGSGGHSGLTNTAGNAWVCLAYGGSGGGVSLNSDNGDPSYGTPGPDGVGTTARYYGGVGGKTEDPSRGRAPGAARQARTAPVGAAATASIQAVTTTAAAAAAAQTAALTAIPLRAA